VNEFRFGNQTFRTKVFMMAPPDRETISVDVSDYIWEEDNAQQFFEQAFVD
jgi:hypothetical protein